MKLVVITEYFHPDLRGGTLARWRLTQRAVEEGIETIVITPREGGLPKEEQVDGVTIKRPVHRPRNKSKTSVRGLFGQIKYIVAALFYSIYLCYKERPDIIHTPSHIMHFIGKVVSITLSIPLINFIGYSPSNTNPVSTRSLAYIFESISLRWFMGDVVLCRTRKVEKLVNQYNSRSHVDQIEGILDESEFETISEREVEKKDTRVAFVGRMDPIKRPRKALQAIKELPEDFVGVFIGDGPLMSDLQEAAEKWGILNRVEFRGRMDHEEVLSELVVTDILILTSHNEAYPSVVFEALATGCEVIAPPVGCLPQIEHERLHITKIESMSEEISSLDHDSVHKVIKKDVKKFSNEKYTEKILEEIHKMSK